MSVISKKIVLIGNGAVGATFAFQLLQTTDVKELIIIDPKEESKGNIADLQDTLLIGSCNKVREGSYEDVKDAAIVVITAGVPRNENESRLDLINRNKGIFVEILSEIMKNDFHGLFLISSNPVDVMTLFTQRITGFPAERVIGTGTSLDTVRLRGEIARRYNVNIEDINANIMGEHGDSSFADFDEATICGFPIREFSNGIISESDLTYMENRVKTKGGRIISKKGATFYGIANTLVQICKAILNNEDKVITVSAPMQGQYGLNNIYIGNPAIINSTGIDMVIECKLSKKEKKMMLISAKQLSDTLIDKTLECD